MKETGGSYMKKVLKLTLLTAIIFLLGTVAAFPSSAQKMNVTRIEGRDRYETAVKLSRYTYMASPKAIVATGEDFPDALAGGSLAAQLDIPILLTEKNKLNPLVEKELERLGTKEVFILGGEGAVGKEVEEELEKTAEVKRIAGRNRYETANEISNMRYEYRKDKSITFPGDFYVFVSGTSYPDALAAAPLVGQINIEDALNVYLLLAQPDQNVSGSTVIGGPQAFSFPVDGYNSEEGNRVYGENRFSTAVEVAKRYPIDVGKKVETIILTNGMNYPDALAAAPLVSNRNAAILLTKTGSLPKETKDYLKEEDIQDVIIIGGESAVSESVVQEINDIK